MFNRTTNSIKLKILQYVTSNTQTNINFIDDINKNNQIKYFPDKNFFYMSLKLNNKKRFPSNSPDNHFMYNYTNKQYNKNNKYFDNNNFNYKKTNYDCFRIVTSDNPHINLNNYNTNEQNSIEKLDFNHIYLLKRINRLKDKLNNNNSNFNITERKFSNNLPKISDFSNSKYNTFYKKNKNISNTELNEDKNKKLKFLNYFKTGQNNNKIVKKLKILNFDKDLIYKIKSFRRKEYNPKNV